MLVCATIALQLKCQETDVLVTRPLGLLFVWSVCIPKKQPSVGKPLFSDSVPGKNILVTYPFRNGFSTKKQMSTRQTALQMFTPRLDQHTLSLTQVDSEERAQSSQTAIPRCVPQILLLANHCSLTQVQESKRPCHTSVGQQVYHITEPDLIRAARSGSDISFTNKCPVCFRKVNTTAWQPTAAWNEAGAEGGGLGG